MKDILLITPKTESHAAAFAKRGYNTLTQLPQEKFTGNVLAECTHENILALKEILPQLSAARIFAYGFINNALKDVLLENAVSDFLRGTDPDLAADYIDVVSSAVPAKTGSILILEQQSAHKKILQNIIKRFDYNVSFVTSIDDLSDKAEMVFVNLDSKNINISALIKKVLGSELKNIPLILYKDIDGLFAHEAASGINRISKIILSTEELYGFLVAALFKKTLSKILTPFCETADYSNISAFSGEPFNKIYNMIGPDIFFMKNILKHENFTTMNKSIESLRDLFLKAEGLRWLTKDEGENKPISKY